MAAAMNGNDRLRELYDLFQRINHDEDGDDYMNLSCDGMDIIEALLAQEGAAAPEGEEWIAWNGGECPVATGVEVEYRMREDDRTSIDRAGRLYWRHGTSRLHRDAEIVAYRIAAAGETTR